MKNKINNINNIAVLIAICILISMLLICHIKNYFYPYTFNSFNNIISYNKQPNSLVCSTKQKTTLEHPILYDKPQHTYVNNINKCKPTQYQVSPNDLILLYKYAYEHAGNEVLLRTLKTIK